MSRTSPFDHRPDAELGAVLREALTAGDDRAFARRVVQAAEHVWAAGAPAEEWWEQVVRWARPELVAAGLLLLVGAALWVQGGASDGNGVTLADVLRPEGLTGVVSVMVAPQAPTLDEVLTVALGN